MDLLSILVVLVVCGLALYLVLTYVPMAAPFPQIITVVVVLVMCLWLLRAFGVSTALPALR
jgi:hypothetical protein